MTLNELAKWLRVEMAEFRRQVRFWDSANSAQGVGKLKSENDFAGEDPNQDEEHRDEAIRATILEELEKEDTTDGTLGTVANTSQQFVEEVHLVVQQRFRSLMVSGDYKQRTRTSDR